MVCETKPGRKPFPASELQALGHHLLSPTGSGQARVGEGHRFAASISPQIDAQKIVQNALPETPGVCSLSSMKCSLVMTVLASDRPGIVKSLSETVASHGGNWLESRMARLAGQFAGIVRVEIAADTAEALIAALDALPEIDVRTRREDLPADTHRNLLKLDVVGNDRPGIVRQLSAAIAGVGANLEDLQTQLESAPMSGHPLFHALATIALPAGTAAGDLVAAIENLSEDLAVTVAD